MLFLLDYIVALEVDAVFVRNDPTYPLCTDKDIICIKFQGPAESCSDTMKVKLDATCFGDTLVTFSVPSESGTSANKAGRSFQTPALPFSNLPSPAGTSLPHFCSARVNTRSQESQLHLRDTMKPDGEYERSTVANVHYGGEEAAPDAVKLLEAVVSFPLCTAPARAS